jgi:hypothetical protein
MRVPVTAVLVSTTAISLGLVRQSETGKSHAGEAETESFERLTPGDGLGHAFSQFIEFVFHTFPFVLPQPPGLAVQPVVRRFRAKAVRAKGFSFGVGRNWWDPTRSDRKEIKELRGY